jgi:hypothetical protein
MGAGPDLQLIGAIRLNQRDIRFYCCPKEYMMMKYIGLLSGKASLRRFQERVEEEADSKRVGRRAPRRPVYRGPREA